MKIHDIFISLTCLVSLPAMSISFNEAVDRIKNHESVESLIYKSKGMQEMGEISGSWGDPMFKIAAKNFPKDTLDRDQTPMTGIEFGVSQKIAISNKYSKIEESYEGLARSMQFSAKDKEQELFKILWEAIIIKDKVMKEKKILSENLVWIDKILKITKQLYANGKTSQQALLDIQIRKSEIESELSNKNYELSQVNDKLIFLIGSSDIKSNTIPWDALKIKNNESEQNDFREKAYLEKVRSAEVGVSAANLDYIPDVTVSVGYTKRSDIDNNGDFVGAAISFPLPFSGSKYSKKAKAVEEKYQAVKEYELYKRSKKRDVAILNHEIQKNSNELKIINNKTVKFAMSSRSITAKSYGLGNSSYIELLQSELKLQKILMQKLMLEAKLNIQKISLKYITGESLNG